MRTDARLGRKPSPILWNRIGLLREWMAGFVFELRLLVGYPMNLPILGFQYRVLGLGSFDHELHHGRGFFGGGECGARVPAPEEDR